MKDRVAVVTGGSRGIGRAVCIALAKEGANVVVNYSGNQAAAEETVKECEAAGVKAIAVKANVAVMEDCEALIAKAVEAFGRVDILVNNAGITRDNLIMRMSEADFDAVVDTNMKGAFLCMKCISRLMMKQRYGRIINISSIVGINGNAGQVNYSASKAGIIGMTKSAAKELASRKITVNAIAPGFIRTDMTDALPEAVAEKLLGAIPLGRLGAAEDVANAVAFFGKEDASYITGQVLCVDGGMAM